MIPLAHRLAQLLFQQAFHGIRSLYQQVQLGYQHIHILRQDSHLSTQSLAFSQDRYSL